MTITHPYTGYPYSQGWPEGGSRGLKSTEPDSLKARLSECFERVLLKKPLSKRTQEIGFVIGEVGPEVELGLQRSVKV